MKATNNWKLTVKVAKWIKVFCKVVSQSAFSSTYGEHITSVVPNAVYWIGKSACKLPFLLRGKFGSPNGRKVGYKMSGVASIGGDGRMVQREGSLECLKEWERCVSWWHLIEKPLWRPFEIGNEERGNQVQVGGDWVRTKVQEMGKHFHNTTSQCWIHWPRPWDSKDANPPSLNKQTLSMYLSSPIVIGLIRWSPFLPNSKECTI